MDRAKTSKTTRARRTAGAAFVAVAGLTLGACATAPQRGTAPQEATVTIRSFAFVPAELTVDPATEVTWTNGDEILHTVTTGTPGKQGVPGVSEDTPARSDGMLDQELDGEGAAVSFMFEDPGAYRYYCAIHAGMTGTVVVR